MKAAEAPKKRTRAKKNTRGGKRPGAGRIGYENPELVKKYVHVVLRPVKKDKLVEKYGGLTAALEEALDYKTVFRAKPDEGTLETYGKKCTYSAYLTPHQEKTLIRIFGSLSNALLMLK